jgi:methylglutaconyl-CoA hydratase
MSEPELTRYEDRGGAAWITLNRPDERNALNDALLVSLRGHLMEALADPDVRCVVLTGAGRAFCAGADLKGERRSVDAGPSPYVEILRAIWNSPKPVIAAVNGAAFAGGLGLVGASDIVIAANSATFSFSEVRIGVIPAVISVVCVPKLGPGQAMRLFLSGERFDAAQARAFGLVHHTVADSEFQVRVETEIAAVLKGGPNALAESKLLVRRIAPFDIDAQFEWAEKKSKELFSSGEGQEGMAAFREKRPPRWTA